MFKKIVLITLLAMLSLPVFADSTLTVTVNDSTLAISGIFAKSDNGEVQIKITDISEADQTFDSLTYAQRMSHVLYFGQEQLTDNKLELVVSVPENKKYGVFTVYTKNGDNMQKKEVVNINPQFFTDINSVTASSQGGLEIVMNLLQSERNVLSGCFSAYYSLSNVQKPQVAQLLVNAAKPLNSLSDIQAIIERSAAVLKLSSGDNADSITVLAEKAELLGITSSAQYGYYLEQSDSFKLQVCDKLKALLNDNEDADTALRSAVVLTQIKNAPHYSVIPDYIHAACVLLNADTPKYSALGSTKEVDSAVKGVSYSTLQALIDEVEAKSNSIKPKSSQGSGGGGGGGVQKSISSPVNFTVGSETETVDEAEKSIFSDVETGRWSYEGIFVLNKRGIISGYSDGAYYPQKSITREEFLKVVLSALNIVDDESSCSFTDVEVSRWSYSYIATAQTYKLVSGRSEKEFDPTGQITREEAAQILYNAVFFKGAVLPGICESPEFSDADMISAWAKESIENLYCCGVIKGNNGAFLPSDNLSREEAAQMIFSVIKIIG